MSFVRADEMSLDELELSAECATRRLAHNHRWRSILRDGLKADPTDVNAHIAVTALSVASSNDSYRYLTCAEGCG
jgi:hypothetical protein